MGEPKKAMIYLTNIEDNNIIKLPISGLNNSTVCLLNETTNESTWGKETDVDQETCKLIQLLEEPVNVHANVKHVKQSIDSTIIGDKSLIYCEKKIFSNRRCNNEDSESDTLYECNQYNCEAKSDLNVNLQKNKDHNYSDLSNNKNVKDSLLAHGALNDTAVDNIIVNTSDDKNISIVMKNNSVSQVKNINDLKKVIPKVKIFGAEVNTLKELTQTHFDDKLNIMESKTPKLIDPREKLSSYCRTCAGLKIPLIDIFSDRGIQMRLNQQMKHLENINQHDSLSTQMCMDCICDLKMSYKFFMQIKKAEVKLKSIHTSLSTVISTRALENQHNIIHDNNLTCSDKSNNTWRNPTEINLQESFPLGLIHTGSTDIVSHNVIIKSNIKPVSNYESMKTDDDVDNNNDDDDDDDDVQSIEEFDPEDHALESGDYGNTKTESKAENIIKKDDDSEMQLSNHKATIMSYSNNVNEMNNSIMENKIINETLYDNVKEVNGDVKIELENVIFDTCLESSSISGRGDITRENNKQPNILKRKPSWHGKTGNFISTNTDSIGKEAKIHKLNTVNISPSDEEGIMYVTVKGSKPNELLLVKVKKMDKSAEKKDDKSSIKKLIDVKPTEKSLKTLPLKDIFTDRSKKLENREAIIEEQIEQYKKKREKVLGGGNSGSSGADIAATNVVSTTTFMPSVAETDEFADRTLHLINFGNNLKQNLSIENSMLLKDESTNCVCEQKDNIEIKNNFQVNDENEIEIFKQSKVHNSEHENTKEYLARLMNIKQKWEEAKSKKELLQKELDHSYTEGNLEKLSKILGEKEKNLKEFQDYLKQRKIVITRLKDQDIISLYEDRNITSMHNKLPDLIDENPSIYSLDDNNLFDCDYCPQIFFTRSALEDHLKSHDYKIFYFCEDCGSEFPNNKTRRAHNITCIKKLICKYCDFMLESKGKKRQHEQKHCDTIFGQLCDICGEKFKHQGTLDQHIKTQHMSWEKVYQCPKCPKKFAFKQKLSFHVKSVHTTLRAYLCEDCGADFKNPASLRHHRIRKHQPTSNKRECPVCHKLVPFYSLSKHMYTHKAYTIQCPHCDKMFKNTSTLKQHIRIHEDQRQHRCDTCGVGFNRRDGLRLHMRVHQKSDSRALKECSCQICSEKFPNHSMLVIHRNRVHKDGKQYTCHICNRSMLSTRSLEWHMSHIHNETPTGVTLDDSANAIHMKRVSCNHCDKTFKTEMILRTHIKNTHMEKNPVKCLDCDLMFTSEVRLRHHMMIAHNRLEGTLTCPHCPKRFVNQLRLKTHMISHSEERPYTCEICGFNLKTKIQLIKHHQNRHSDERPLQCSRCEWRCKQVSALVCHERTHTNERPYSCIVCKQRFKYLGDKNKHERRHESLGGSGFKRIVVGRNVKHIKNHEGEISTSENDPLEQEYQIIDGQLTDQHVECDIKYDEEQQIIKFEGQEIENEKQNHIEELDQEHQQHIQQGINEEDDDEEEDEDDDEIDIYEEEEDDEEDLEHQQTQEESEAEADNDYKQVYKHDYEEISRETSEATEVIMNMEDATVYTEEVTADNIESAEMISAEMMTNQILQTGTVVHIQQQDDDGKIQVIPVMLSLPDLTDSATEINLGTGSIIYNN
ncbi:hypothetical protein PV327_004038 [Microctonus hyperodae]|uniref:Uncharacterized protein n=1 Tax=Microctonus hyperodae TaxID=165561 RepID=A0AA39G5M0_MICHY|nr:hypothetical protein PV327_004038 [Microctonus hyperodae]